MSMIKEPVADCCFSKSQLYALAATFALSNMGQRVEVEKVSQLMERGGPSDLYAAVDFMCGPYVETDEHEEIFYGEGEMWYGEFRQITNLEAFLKTWKHNTSWLQTILEANMECGGG